MILNHTYTHTYYRQTYKAYENRHTSVKRTTATEPPKPQKKTTLPKDQVSSQINKTLCLYVCMYITYILYMHVGMLPLHFYRAETKTSQKRHSAMRVEFHLISK